LDRGGLVFAGADEIAKILPDFRTPSLPFMAGQALRAGLSVTRAALERAGVRPVFSSSDLLCLGRADALGGYMLFHAASVTDPWAALVHA
jgi:hypothetical protein